MILKDVYKNLITSNHIGYLVLDEKGRIIDTNKEYIRLTGKKRLKDVIGHSVLEWTDKKDIKKNKEALRECLKKGYINNLRINYLNKNKIVPVEINASVIKQNEKTYILGICRDISDMIKVEKKLKDIVSISADWIWEINKKGRYTFVSQRIKEILGYSPKEIIGKTPFDLMPKENAKHIKALFKDIIIHKKPIINLENWNISKNGKRVCLLTNGIPIIKNGKLIGYRGVDKDITKLKENEEKIIKLKKELETTFNNINDVIVSTDLRGNILYINKALKNITGYESKSLIGKNFRNINFISKKSLLRITKAIILLLHKKEVKPYDIEITTKDGKLRIGEIKSNIIKENGKITKFLAIIRDVTEQRKLINTLSKINKTFISLGSDPKENIKKIINTAGEIIGGACALYNRLDNQMLCTWGIWNKPMNYKSIDNPQGHICYDVILKNKRKPFILEDLTGTLYEKTDPNVIKYKLKSYLGIPIILNGKVVGSFCIVDNKKRKFSEFEIKTLSLLGEAIVNEEKRLESKENLIKMKEKFKQYLNLANVLMVAIDKKGNVIYINKKGCEILGYKKEEIIGKNWFDNFVPNRVKKELIKLLKEADHKKIKDHINPILTKNKEEKIIQWHNDILKQNGKIIGYLSSGNDITEQYKIDKILKESELKFRNIIKKVRLGIVLGDDKGNIIEFNPAAEKIYGISKTKVLKMKVWELEGLLGYNAIKRGLMKFLYLTAAKTGVVRNKPIKTTIKTKKGIRYISFKLSVIKKEKGYYIIQLIDDITEQINMMTEIKKERDLLQKYIDLSGLIITVLDNKGKVLSINKKGLEIFGYDKKEVIGKSWFNKFVPPNEKIKIRKSFNDVLINGEGDFESNILTKKGESRLIDWHSTILKNDNGKVIGILNTGEDITEKRKKEKEIRKLKEEVEINEARKNFLLLITHELKQPLTPIMGYADLLKENETNVDKLEYLDRIINGANEMYELVTKIINLMRIETGQLLFHFKEISLKQLIDDALRKKASLINLRSIRIKKDVSDVKFIGDYNLLRDLLVNLIDNAIKFSKDKQTITITGKSSGKWVIFSVKDEGQGIKKEDLPKLFKTFSQTIEGRKKGGFGIGLSMCKMIAEKHGGTISVKSEYGKGSTFIVKIPKKRGENIA